MSLSSNPRAPRRLALAAGLLIFLTCFPHAAMAQGSLLRRVMQTFARRFTTELAEEGAEQTGKRLARVLARHGDDLAPALEKLGPRAVRLADELPEGAAAILRKHGRTGLNVLQQHGGEAVALFRAHGDDAVKLLAAHPGVGAGLARTLGGEAVPALSRLSRTEAVRLAKLADDVAKLPPEAKKTVLERLAQGGDDFVVWLWRRKKEVFGSAALAGVVIATYKLGDGMATAVPAMLPRSGPPPDPVSHPGLALLDRWVFPGMIAAGLTVLGAVWLIRRRARRVCHKAPCCAGFPRCEVHGYSQKSEAKPS